MDYDSDSYDGYDSDYSNGEPCLYLKEEVRRGDLEAVRTALEENGSWATDYDDERGVYTILHWAAGLTDEENLEEVRASQVIQLHVRREIVRLLLQHAAKVGVIWWQEGFLGDHSGVRPWDLTNDASTQTLLLRTCIEQTIKAIEESSSVEREMIQSGFCATAILNQTSELKTIFDHGVDVDDDACDYTALSQAASRGNMEAVVTLVETCGASVNHEVRYTSTLWIAAKEARIDVIRFLIQKSADVFFTHPLSGGFGLMFVESVEVIDLILEEMRKRIPEDLPAGIATATAFQAFTAFGDTEGLQRLLNAGAKIPSKALPTTVAFGQKDALELLLAGGALKTYDETETVCFYGIYSRKPSEELVAECKGILEQTSAAFTQWRNFASGDERD